MHHFPFMNVADVSVIAEYLEWHLIDDRVWNDIGVHMI
jgi:hypothetical protein